jgi:hypothetical protein
MLVSETKRIGPPPYDAEALIEKINNIGKIIANTKDLDHFKHAVEMLFDRLETSRLEDGT